MSHELRLFRPQTQYRTPEHMYLKFLTTLKSSVEKFVNLTGLKFINQEITIYYLVNVDHKGMAMCLSRSDCEGIWKVKFAVKSIDIFFTWRLL